MRARDAVCRFIQIGCPRLSVDWGDSFDKPILSSYEGMVALEQLPWRPVYPMVRAHVHLCVFLLFVVHLPDGTYSV